VWPFRDYRLEFGPIDLTKAGDYKFQITNAPPASFDTYLINTTMPRGFPGADWIAEVDVKLLDENGNVVSANEASRQMIHLTPQAFGFGARVRNFQLKRNHAYTLIIGVLPIQTKSNAPKPFFVRMVGEGDLPD